MKRKIIVGNWKMNPSTWSEAQNNLKKVKNIASRLKTVHTIICPPSVYITKLASSSGSLGIGAQDTFYESQGAFTGEVSSIMLKDLGVTHVIVGHSERRSLGETDEIVAKKVQSVIEMGMHPIVCVGEIERDINALYLETLKSQIKDSLARVPKKLIGQIIVAYEPVWAIGVKEAMDPAIIEEMTIFVRKVLSDIFGQENAIKTPILYGGSINFRNAADIMSRGKVDGLLVGRESLNTPGFVELLKAVDAI